MEKEKDKVVNSPGDFAVVTTKKHRHLADESEVSVLKVEKHLIPRGFANMSTGKDDATVMVEVLHIGKTGVCVQYADKKKMHTLTVDQGRLEPLPTATVV